MAQSPERRGAHGRGRVREVCIPQRSRLPREQCRQRERVVAAPAGGKAAKAAPEDPHKYKELLDRFQEVQDMHCTARLNILRNSLAANQKMRRSKIGE